MFEGESEASKSNRISAFDSVDPNSYLIKQSIQLRKSERVMFKVTEGHLRSFGGNFVVLNSNLISAFNSASQKPIRRHIHELREIW